MTSTKTYKAEEALTKTTDVFWWNFNSKERIVINQGGSSSGKTYAILQVLLLRLIESPGTVATVVGSTIPNLKKGAMRDFERILSDTPVLSRCIKCFNKKDRTYTLTNGAVLEFTSYEDDMQARSGKRDYAFFNEANGIHKGIFDQVAMRTARQIFIDYNPTAAFWVHSELIGQPDTVTFYSTFANNKYAEPANVKHIRRYKERDPEMWRVYGLGKTGAIRGLVFPRVNRVEKMPSNFRKSAYGLDFGYNDPTACVLAGEQDSELYVQEVLYQFELTAPQIADKLKAAGVGSAVVWCDSASPMTIAELKANGVNARPAPKGRDSIVTGINLIKGFERINITADSTNLFREQQNYRWKEKDGVQMDKPADSFNHLWDATRYAVVSTWGNVGRLPSMV